MEAAITVNSKKRGRLDNSGAGLSYSRHAGDPDDPKYILYHYLCQCALDWFYSRKVKGQLYKNVKVSRLLKKKFDAEKSCHHLHISFKAYFPDDKPTQEFETSILFRARRRIQIVIVYVGYVGQDSPSLGNLSDYPIDYISESDNDDDCEVSELNPAFVKEVSKKKSRGKSLEKGPTYRPCPQAQCMRRPLTGGYKEGSDVSKDIEKFNTDVKNSGGFEVDYYPHMDAAGIYGTSICKYYDIDNKPLPATSLTKLLHLSQLALCFYNMKEDTDFYNVKVLKAMTYICGGAAYNITFKASTSVDHAEIFQTNITTSFALPVNKIEMVFVRIKPN